MTHQDLNKTMSSRTPPQGIHTPLPTFFKQDSNYLIDLDTQLRHFDYIQNSGVSGVLVGGSNGEACHLSSDERYSIIKAIKGKITKENFIVMAGAIGNSMLDIINDISTLKRIGADFAVLLVPGYFGTTLTKQQGIIDWFKIIADKSDLPIIIYNYPGVQNGIDLTYDSYLELSKHPNIVGCKLTHYNFPLYILLAQSQQLKHENFTVLAGVGQVLLPGLAVGVEGCIDGLSNIFPKSMVEIFNAFTRGDLEKCKELQRLVTEVNQMTAVLNILGLKYGLKHMLTFGDCETGRPPLNQKIDIEVWEKYLPAFKQLLEIEQSL